jgi:hypothetical protein
MIVESSIAEVPQVSAATASDVLMAMAAAASRAPSGDNLQPWRFALDAERRRLEVWLDEETDRSSLNQAQRMSRLGCGAAIECAICAAEDLGWSCDVRMGTGSGQPLACIELREDDATRQDIPLQALIKARSTNRNLYDQAPIPAMTLAALHAATPQRDETAIHWITDRHHIDTLARLAMRADTLLYSESSMRRAFLNNLRFDLPLNASADRGLPLGALGASAFEILTLRLLRITPDVLFGLTPGAWIFSRYSGRLIRSSSGLCIVSGDGSANADVSSGRAMLRAWLALTAHGLAVQPMMSSVMMTHALEWGSPELLRSMGLKKLRAFVAEFRATLATLGIAGSPHFLMRFGTAPAPTVRTGRLPLAELLRKSGDSGA